MPACGSSERALLSETLLLPEIALFILFVYRFRRNPSIGRAAFLGGMAGLMAVTRSEQILIFPLVVLPVVLVVNWGKWRRALAWLALAAAVLALLIIPWTIFNLGRFDRPVLLSNGFGPAVGHRKLRTRTTDRTSVTESCLVCLPTTAATSRSMTASTYTMGSNTQRAMRVGCRRPFLR